MNGELRGCAQPARHWEHAAGVSDVRIKPREERGAVEDGRLVRVAGVVGETQMHRVRGRGTRQGASDGLHLR